MSLALAALLAEDEAMDKPIDQVCEAIRDAYAAGKPPILVRITDDYYRACLRQMDEDGGSPSFSRSTFKFEGVPIILGPIRLGGAAGFVVEVAAQR